MTQHLHDELSADSAVESEQFRVDFRRKWGALKVAAYVLLMVGSFWVQSQAASQTLRGVVAQFQVVLSVFMVLSLPKYGFISVFAVLGAEITLIFSRMVLFQDWEVLPGLLVCTSTLIVTTIISLFGRHLTRKNMELRRQQAKLSVLNRDLAEAGEIALHMANHDAVTGMKNALCLRSLIDDFYASRKEDAPSKSLILVELENFKLISSILGQRSGEKILRQIAQRIQEKTALASAEAARMDGSCFALFASLESDLVEGVIRQIQQAIHEPLTIGEETLEIRSCAGYAQTSNDAIDADSLLRCADLALAAAREERRSSIKRYDGAMALRARRRVDLANELELALERKEFIVHYQPQIDVLTGKVLGAEALVRWNNVRLGNPLPEEFIPVAEQNGQIVPLGNWILEQACRDATHWPASWKVAVNVSGGQFIDRAFETDIDFACVDSGLLAGRLKLEVTESVLIGDEQKVEERLTRIRSRSMSISLDDFGTGYSSLSYLTQLPLDELKIDRSFVWAMESDPKVLAVVETILRLAKQLNLATTAEGVELQSQATLLAQMGCDRLQGYLYARPLTQKALLARFGTDPVEP